MKLSPAQYPLLCFDLDDTLITDNTWYRFNTALGIPTEKDLELYTAYHAGHLSYANWTEILHSLYRTDVSRKDIEAIFSEYTIAPGAKEAVAHARARGYIMVIITGSFSEAAAVVGRELGIAYTYGVTHCTYDESDIFAGIVSSGEERFAKLDLLSQLSSQLDIPLAKCIAIGDSENDIEIFHSVGQAITFSHVADPVANCTDAKIDSLHDLIQLL